MKRSLQLKKKFLKLNNKGLSLVELIVAILILAIISVSAMQLFVSSSKVNRVNKTRNNADTVATNVMEGIKVNGLPGTAKQVYLCQFGDVKTLAKATTIFGLDLTTAIDKQTVQLDGSIDKASATIDGKLDARNNAIYPFVSSAPYNYEYLLQGVEEGNQKFNVEITFNTNFQNKKDPAHPVSVNDKDKFVLSAFDTDNSFYINPLAPDIMYDQEALDFFVQLNKAYIKNCYDSDKAVVDNNNAYWTQRAEDAGASVTEEPYASHMMNAPDPALYVQSGESAIENAIKRVTTITIEHNNVVSQQERYSVSSEMNYTIPYDSTKLNYQNMVAADAAFPGTGYCTKVGYDKEANKEVLYIYYMYIPYKYIKTTGVATLANNANVYTFTNESIVVHNTTPLDVELYIAVQGYRSATGELEVIYETVPGESNKDVAVFSNADIKTHIQASTNDINYKLLKKDTSVTSEHNEDIAEVTIKVYSMNSDGSSGELIREMTSTIER